MTIGLMQPYFLPYIGYFQLMKAVDVFVYYDDVNYIKQGWINRNYILLNGKDHRFTLELKGASSFKHINEIEVGKNRNKLLKTFIQAYSKAPYFEDNFYLIEDIFKYPAIYLIEFINNANYQIYKYLRFALNMDRSSLLFRDNSLKGKDAVIDICKIFGADTYINAIGGQSLYSKDEFKQNEIDLLFLKPDDNLPKRSIIDVLMNYSKDKIIKMLDQYELC